MLEMMLVFPLYGGIFTLFFSFRFLIKTMTELNEIFSEMFSEDSVSGVLCEQGERARLFNRKSKKWRIHFKLKLQNPMDGRATEKVLRQDHNQALKKCVNLPSVKIDKRETLEMGKSICPIVIEMYAEGLKTVVEQMPYVKTRCTINTEKLKADSSANKLFCDSLAIKIGSKLLEQMGEIQLHAWGCY